MEANSEGRIAVELYPNSSLGTERVMFEACQMGTLEVAYGTTSVLANFDKNMEVLDLPFLFEDEATARAAITGELGTAAAANLGDIGLINLTYMENGIRHVTNSSHPINTPDDLRDLKIRTMENSIRIPHADGIYGTVHRFAAGHCGRRGEPALFDPDLSF